MIGEAARSGVSIRQFCPAPGGEAEEESLLLVAPPEAGKKRQGARAFGGCSPSRSAKAHGPTPSFTSSITTTTAVSFTCAASASKAPYVFPRATDGVARSDETVLCKLRSLLFFPCDHRPRRRASMTRGPNRMPGHRRPRQRSIRLERVQKGEQINGNHRPGNYTCYDAQNEQKEIKGEPSFARFACCQSCDPLSHASCGVDNQTQSGNGQTNMPAAAMFLPGLGFDKALPITEPNNPRGTPPSPILKRRKRPDRKVKTPATFADLLGLRGYCQTACWSAAFLPFTPERLMHTVPSFEITRLSPPAPRHKMRAGITHGRFKAAPPKAPCPSTSLWLCHTAEPPQTQFDRSGVPGQCLQKVL